MSTFATHVVHPDTEGRAEVLKDGLLSVSFSAPHQPPCTLVGPWEHVLRVVLDASEAAVALTGSFDAEGVA